MNRSVQRPLLRRFTLAGLAAAAVVASAAVAPAARPTRPTVEGTYQGAATSTQGNPSLDVELTLNPLVKRKLSGTLVLSQGEEPIGSIPVKGTLSASNNVSLTGKVDRKNLVITGQFTPADGMGSAQTITGTYKITGGVDRGTFTVSAP